MVDYWWAKQSRVRNFSDLDPDQLPEHSKNTGVKSVSISKQICLPDSDCILVRFEPLYLLDRPHTRTVRRALIAQQNIRYSEKS